MAAHFRVLSVDGLMREDGATGLLACLTLIALHKDKVVDIERFTVALRGCNQKCVLTKPERRSCPRC